MDADLVLGGAPRAHCKKKEKLDEAAAEVSRTGKTSFPFFRDVRRAVRINRVVGFGMLTPWEIPQLDEETLAAFDALDELNRREDDKRRSKQEFENTLARTRAKHPSYRKYR